jgi:Uma2 family endonuclease
MLEGPPTLAVEILSPSYSIDEIETKTRMYLAHGVELVWVVNPYSKIVIADRPEGPPEFFHVENDLTANGVLPGLKVPVAEIVFVSLP